MPPRADELFLSYLLEPLAYGLLSSLIFAIAISARRIGHSFVLDFRHNIVQALGYSLPLVLLGYISGYLSGLSRSSVVGNVIPPILAAVAGMAVYLFGKEKKQAAIVGFSVVIFSLLFFYGIQTGSFEREFGFLDRMKILSEQEDKLREYRINLGLDPSPPSWLLGTDPK